MRKIMALGAATALAFAVTTPTPAFALTGGSESAVIDDDDDDDDDERREYRRNRDRGEYARQARRCPRGTIRLRGGCVTQRQYRRLTEGQRYRSNYGYNRYAYGQIPVGVRQRYGLDPSDRYYYNNGYLYQVDPRTQLIEEVIRLVLR